MIAKKYKSEIVSILNPLEGIYTLEFRSLDRPYKYLPGQFLHLAIDDEYDGTGQWPDSRCFSMQSNPSEKTIRVTYSVKGVFTSVMQRLLKIGSIVWLKLPYGDLFQQLHSKENTVFIAGGTGITPFLSLFTHEDFFNYINPIIYLGFRSKQFNIYQAELDLLKKRYSERGLGGSITCNTYYQDSDGLIDIKKIVNENGANATYFISGPPSMIKSFKNHLINLDVNQTKILTDDWE